ncbi:MAG: hypothetical protein M1830_010836 [Pleopsidium flavum]|nr:MAG: hypothetical protein M1830_010836 [Pleopsidium flavum]
MSTTSRERYMNDRFFENRPLSAIEQRDVDTAIAASLVPEQAHSNGWSSHPLPVSPSGTGLTNLTTQNAALREARTYKEEQNIQEALHASIEDSQKGKADSGTSHVPQSSTLEKSHASSANLGKPQSLTERIENMASRLATELPLLNATDADTLVFIDPPPQQPAQGDYAYQQYMYRYKLPHRMHREKFLALNSPYFEKAFGPSTQHRVLRRRCLVNNLPTGIKFVLDLTPPIEGEDAVYLMTELCCSPGTRKWFQAAQRWNIANRLVAGQDELQAEPKVNPSHLQDPQKDDSSKAMNEGRAEWSEMRKDTEGAKSVNMWTSKANHTAESKVANALASSTKEGESVKWPSSSPGADVTAPIPLEYTAVRHRSAIERVLHAAVEGLDPRIDSAPKLWTTFAVAKYFEVKHSPLTDYIVSWLRATPNSYFLEVLPEVSQKIADGLQCEDLCRDTFAILVGEEALTNVWRARNQPGGSPAYTVYGRRREDLHEDYQTRIEYASKSFVERVNSRFSTLVNESMSWLEEIPAYFVLSTLKESTDNESTIKELKNMLKAYVRGRIYWVLCREYRDLGGPVPDTGYIDSDLFPTASFTSIYAGLLPRERIFTQSYWKTLRQEDFSLGSANTYTNEDSFLAPIAGWTSSAQAMRADKLFEEVPKSRLTDLVGQLDQRRAQMDSSTGSRSIQAILPHRPARSAGDDGNVQQLGDLSLGSPSKTQPHLKYDVADEEHDGKRRRISGALGDRSNAGKERLGSSSQLPIRLACMSPFSQQVARLRESIPSSLNSAQRVSAKKASASDPKVSALSDDSEEQLVNIPDGAVFAIESSPSRTVDDGHMHDTARISPGDWPTPDSFHAWTAEKAPWSETASTEGLHENNDFKPFSTKRFLPKKYDSGFSLGTFLLQVNNEIRGVCAEMLAPPDFSTRSDTLDLALTDTLVCLVGSEWKYLPLWAGGNDDGSGGVFDDSVPLAEPGVSAGVPGPGFHTGLSSAGSSEYELIGNSQDRSSSFHTSTVVNDGLSDQFDRRRVYDADSVWGDVMAKKDQGVASTAKTGKGKGKLEYADSEWSEVTAGREINEVPSDKARTGELDDMDNSQRLDGADELLDDIWNEGEEEAYDSTLESDNDSDLVMI